ncbi:hypothetical protein [Botrimarina hoheduenensis]|uniref:PEP-CTERM protein-sorting domain-containing protein n=1 Tax=Botrimarina hoheduenensis TaxID=2528000 RepID=A0A5C5W8U3_9BACT|nr:hypothetical protein [Botrimarina hoheduenensis]TWT46441.1 hypothetical protein Pla111_15370 [Botrimarina hoheduenensis]
MKRLVLLLVLSHTSLPASATVSSFDDIRLWSGAGAYRAALAIDWDGASIADEALVWGFRWNGVATGEDLLRSAISADPRLYAKLAGIGANGAAVIGLGYDLNADGQFAISDQTLFDAHGLAMTAPSDGATSLPGDLYSEGWEDGYWHYGVRSAAGAWQSSQVGASSRVLSDGQWHGFAFALTNNYDEFAMNLLAAEPPSLAGDFNHDQLVDVADYTVWRDAVGMPDGLTPADYDVWVANFGTGGTALSTPEPATIVCALLGIAAVATNRNRHRSARRSAASSDSPRLVTSL